MKVLNLYACLGCNRYLWDNCEVTAVELDPELARLYQERFPNDTVIVADAHQYLLDHYKDFDFIWSSPPCPTHSRARWWAIGTNGKDPVYPDMKLYQEILFLQHHAKCKWVVENVIPYYEPLIPAQKMGRHLYWSNFRLTSPKEIRKINIGSGTNEVAKLCKFHNIDLSTYKGEQRKDKIARNLVDYEVGKHIFDIARGIYNKQHYSNGTKEIYR
jgi:DNA (cytosine-5)-methyltransferase 1